MAIAYVDESQMRRTGGDAAYFLGTTIVASAADGPGMRDALVRLKPRAQAKLHWYDAVDRLRSRTMSTIASFELDHLVVEHRAREGERPERSRRACIELMMHELSGFDVEHVVFESRGRADDKRDRTMLDSLRARKLVRGIRFDHVLGNSEPSLWMPDAVLGAVESYLLGEPKYFNQIESRALVLRTPH